MDGLDRLLDTLRSLGADGGDLSAQNVRLVLAEARERDWEFERAWEVAMSRLQAPQLGKTVDLRLHGGLREDRILFEEDRVHFHAAYERRALTEAERLGHLTAAQARLDEALQRPAERRRSAAA